MATRQPYYAGALPPGAIPIATMEANGTYTLAPRIGQQARYYSTPDGRPTDPDGNLIDSNGNRILEPTRPAPIPRQAYATGAIAQRARQLGYEDFVRRNKEPYDNAISQLQGSIGGLDQSAAIRNMYASRLGYLDNDYNIGVGRVNQQAQVGRGEIGDAYQQALANLANAQNYYNTELGTIRRDAAARQSEGQGRIQEQGAAMRDIAAAQGNAGNVANQQTLASLATMEAQAQNQAALADRMAQAQAQSHSAAQSGASQTQQGALGQLTNNQSEMLAKLALERNRQAAEAQQAMQQSLSSNSSEVARAQLAQRQAIADLVLKRDLGTTREVYDQMRDDQRRQKIADETARAQLESARQDAAYEQYNSIPLTPQGLATAGLGDDTVENRLAYAALATSSANGIGNRDTAREMLADPGIFGQIYLAQTGEEFKPNDPKHVAIQQAAMRAVAGAPASADLYGTPGVASGGQATTASGTQQREPADGIFTSEDNIPAWAQAAMLNGAVPGLGNTADLARALGVKPWWRR